MQLTIMFLKWKWRIEYQEAVEIREQHQAEEDNPESIPTNGNYIIL